MRAPFVVLIPPNQYCKSMRTTLQSTNMEYPDSPKTVHNSEFAMQKYLLLQNKHDELQRHMHDICPTTLYGYASSSTAATSPSLSPTRSSTMSPPMSLSSSPSRRQNRRASAPNASRTVPRTSQNSLPPLLDEEVMVEMAADQQRLCNVNEGLKRVLTELLNCEVVRQDGSMRTWVQSRLMDTERELRTSRRRRSSGSAD